MRPRGPKRGRRAGQDRGDGRRATTGEHGFSFTVEEQDRQRSRPVFQKNWGAGGAKKWAFRGSGGPRGERARAHGWAVADARAGYIGARPQRGPEPERKGGPAAA
eukprot:scaffold7377_cov389-Prasinococcus_capsulatus_cf.AAC.28